MLKPEDALTLKYKTPILNLCPCFFFRGKITYYTHPPEKQQSHVSAEIVTKMAQEFDINSLLTDEQNTLKGKYYSGLLNYM